MPTDHSRDLDCNSERTTRIGWYHYVESEKPIRNNMEWGNKDEHHDEP